MGEQAKANREAMPIMAAVRDEWKGVFGPLLRLTFAEEGGREVGKRRPPERSMSGEQWRHFLKTGQYPEGGR